MNATFWLILTFCFGLFSAVLYLLVRGDVVTPYVAHRGSRLMPPSERIIQYNSKLKVNKRIIDETIYYAGINFVLNTSRYRDMSLDEVEYFLINIEEDESIIDDYVEGNLKDNEDYKKGVIQGLKRLLDIKKYGRSTI